MLISSSDSILRMNRFISFFNASEMATFMFECLAASIFEPVSIALCIIPASPILSSVGACFNWPKKLSVAELPVAVCTHDDRGGNNRIRDAADFPWCRLRCRRLVLV